MNTKDKLLKLRKLADAMYYAAQHLTTDASRLHKAMDEYYQFIINEYHKEEPVSEIDFEQELYKYFGQVKDFTLGMRIAKRFYEIGRNHQEPASEDLEEAAEEWDESLYRSDAFKAGAKWMNNTVCSEIEKRLEYMQYAPHRADTYKELKSLLAYIKSYV